MLREIGLRGSPDEKSLLRQSDIESILHRVAEQLGFELSRYEREELLRYLERDQKQFGILQELIDTESLTDIIVTNYAKIGFQEGRRNFTTGLSFASQATYEAFVERILLAAGTTYSTKKPIADGMIGDRIRVHAVHPTVCESGPYLTIRVNRFSSISVENLKESGAAPSIVFDYLTALIQGSRTLFIVGEVGTGKTTLVRGLAAAIPHEEAILVIEDTPEIRLNHPHVRYISTRESNAEDAGRVSPSEVIRGGMRMAMNRIIFGEIRDAEAAEAFVDVCASGHPGLSTIHARSGLEAITRLELFLGRAQRGVERSVLNEQICTAVHVIVFMGVCPHTRKRRVMEVYEIGPAADGVIRHREMFRYGFREGKPQWQVVSKISGYRAILENGESPLVLGKLPSILMLSDEKRETPASERNLAWKF